MQATPWYDLCRQAETFLFVDTLARTKAISQLPYSEIFRGKSETNEELIRSTRYEEHSSVNT